MVSQEPSSSQTELTQIEAETLIKISAKPDANLVATFKALASEEEALEQSSHRIAVIYREMAVPSESDLASARELKSHYQRLAEEEERAASVAKRMAAYHARLAALVQSPQDATKTKSLLADQGYRR
jgi:prephenate dehydratase